MLMHKSQLHELVHRHGWPHPDYSHVREGAAHVPKFQATVTVNGVSYLSQPGFATLKAAEHDAARVALAEITKTLEGDVSRIQSTQRNGLCKNALQEYAQKSGLPLPVYRTERSGEDHDPLFTATVELGGTFYTGGPAKTKKEAEFKAAKIAMVAIKIVPELPQPVPETPETSQRNSHKRKRARVHYHGQPNARIKVEPPDQLPIRYTLNEPASSNPVSASNEQRHQTTSSTSQYFTLSLRPPSIVTQQYPSDRCQR